MKHWFVASVLATSAWAVSAEVCYLVGTTVTAMGHAMREGMELFDGASEDRWILSIDPPLCVRDERNTQDPQGRVMVSRAQLLGSVPPTGLKLLVTGTIGPKGDADYTIQPTSIRIAETDSVHR